MKTSKLLFALTLLSFVAPRALPQSTYSQPRITVAVNNTKLTVLRGNTYPLAQSRFDRGPAPASLPMQDMLLVLKRSPAQEAALDSFMAQQLDRSSANYHHWLSPAEFGQLYGPAQADIDTITKWLVASGFQVNSVSPGRTTIDFSGTAGQVQSAFHTTIHQYVVNGKQHWANSTDPSIPSALAPVVVGIRSLHNFTPRPETHLRRASARPNFTFNSGNSEGCDIAGSSVNCYAVGPNDFATIYGVGTLWNNGVDGTGQTIAVVGDSNINLQDIAQFRSIFSLPANVPNVILANGTDPGLNSDEIEAALDTEWSGGVAKGATIDLVIAPSTNTQFGGDIAADYVINCQTASPNCSHGVVPAKILSESFGECELGLGSAGNAMYNSMWQQAAAEGITVIVSSGDNGSAGCDIDEINGPVLQPAENGLQVNGVASTQYNVAVGGTDFDDIGTQSLYWNTAAGTQSSALKYIPENVWDDTCTNPEVLTLVGVSTQTASCSLLVVQQAGLVEVTGSSGGESNCTTFDGTNPSGCTGGNTKPSWQTSAGTPGTTRDLPDVSLFAGDGFAGSFYVMCEMDTSASSGGQGGQPCVLGTVPNFVGVGGTSASAQAFAGIMALVDQKNGDPAAGQGNVSSVLYALAASQSAGSCNSSSGPSATCIFNDITKGTNSMPCVIGSLNCITTAGVPGVPADHDPVIGVRTIRILCALGIGLLLLLIVWRKEQRRVTIAALCATGVLLVVSVGCSSNSGSNPNGGEGTPEGVLSGYSAGTGYDLATGLGTINANNLVTDWGNASAPAAPPSVAPLGTLPLAVLAGICALFLGLMFLGLRRRQIRWSTAVVLIAFAVSILSAASSNASTRANRQAPQRPAPVRMASLRR